MSKIKTGLRIGTLAALCAIGAAVNGTHAANLPESVKALLPAAKAEGKALVWGITLNARQVASMNKGFNGFYGTNIKILHYGGSHGRKAGEIARAYRAGVPTGVDIFWTAAPTSVIKAGALVKVDWNKEFGIDKALQISDYAVNTHHSYSTMITVNTDLVKPKDYPRTYDDLLDPKWKGRFAMARSRNAWMQVAYGLGEAKAVELLTGILTMQKPKVLPKTMDVRARVISGEYAIGMGVDAFKAIRAGAPVHHPDLDVLLLNTAGAWILKDSKSKNVAKLWGYWITTPHGQKVLHDTRGFSMVTTKGTDINKYAQGKKVHRVPAGWRMKNQRRLAKMFGKIMKKHRKGK